MNYLTAIKQVISNSVEAWLLKALKSSCKFISNNWIFILPAIAIFIAWFLAATYAKIFPSVNTWLRINFQFREAQAWGQLGDFVGGLLNPLISLFTLLIAALVWKLQKQELAETRKAIKDQTFDQFFMSVLASHRAMSEQVSLVDKTEAATIQTGKRAIDSYRKYLTSFDEKFNEQLEKNMPSSESSDIFSVAGDTLKSTFEIWKLPDNSAISMLSYFCVRYYKKNLSVTNQFELFAKDNYLSFEQIFGHIFRSTYQILKLVDEQFPKPEDKKKAHRYVNLLRAQMSESEFIFFALSAITKEGKKSWARSVRLDFFQDRLQNSPWTKSLSVLFKPNDANIQEANEILKEDENAD